MIHPLARAYLEQLRACILDLAPHDQIGPKLSAWVEASAPVEADPREIDHLTPRWREGEPPADAWVWLEGCEDAALTYRNATGALCYQFVADTDIDGDPIGYLWEARRWAPHLRPA